MTKDQVYSVVKKHLLDTVDGLDESQIDPAKSMKDLGVQK